MKELLELIKILSNKWEYKNMRNYIVKQCIKHKAEVHIDNNNNIIASKGNGIKTCIVSHYDTVHYKVPDKVKIIGDYIYGFGRNGEPRPTGGDNKCGVYIALKMLEKFDNIKTVFFYGEEEGCIGSNAIDMMHFDDCKLVMQSDKEGGHYIVYEDSKVKYLSGSNEKIVKTIANKYSMVRLRNGDSDVTTLVRRGLKCGAFIYSSGYYEQHSDREIIKISDLKRLLSFTRDIVKQVKNITK